MKKDDEMEQPLLSKKDFEGIPIRPNSSNFDILIQVATVYRNKLNQCTQREREVCNIAATDPISVEGKERSAKGKKLKNSVIESVTNISGSKRKGFDNAERGFQFKKQKIDMDSSSESKEPSSSLRTKSKPICHIEKSTTKGGDDKQRKPKPKEITPQSIDANDLPEEYKRKIENFDKAKATLVIQKELTKTDLSPSACRLSMPMNQIKPQSFLTVDEIEFLARNNDWPVSVLDPLLEEEDLVLTQWDMRKPKGKTSSSYMLKTRWNKVADKNKLQLNDVIQVWSFRDMENNLHFAIVLVKKAKDDGGEHSNSEGSSQPSPPSTTTSRDIVDGERSSGSGQDIDGERSSGRHQGTETKEESTIGGNSNDENDSGRITMSNGLNDNHESLAIQ